MVIEGRAIKPLSSRAALGMTVVPLRMTIAALNVTGPVSLS
jgi:hypothetical protein